MKKATLHLGCCLLLAAHSAFSAQLCGKISGDSVWQGGIFSIVNEKGVTVASTDLILTGKSGCTNIFPADTYTIRFTGALDKLPTIFDGIYGCLTSPYFFNDSDTMSVVFDNGRPPFNGNSFCVPGV